MSDPPSKPTHPPTPPTAPPSPPRRTKSGESTAVRAFRDKLDSIQEGTYPVLEELNRQADDLKSKSRPPPEPASASPDETPTDPMIPVAPKTPKENSKP